MEPTLTRTRAVQTRLSDNEAAALERLAYQEGCTVAYFLRRVILKQILVPSDGSNGSVVEPSGVLAAGSEAYSDSVEAELSGPVEQMLSPGAGEVGNSDEG